MQTDAKPKQAIPRSRLAALFSALLAVACSSGLTGAPKTSPGEIEQLKRQVVALRQRATVAELEGDRLKREIARLKTELGRAPAKEASAERLPPDAQTGRVAETQTGRVEEARPEPIASQTLAEPEATPGRSEPEAAEPETEVEPTAPATIGLHQEIEETDLEPPPPTPPAASPPAASPPIATSEPSITADEQPITAPSAAAQALYDEGYTLFHQKRYADAEARFARYIELYPQTDLADNALFWIGECRYAQGDFGSALEAFSNTVERYPSSNKVSDALLKAGKCLESLGETQQAHRTYQEVVDRYPNSAAAAQARDRLKGRP